MTAGELASLYEQTSHTFMVVQLTCTVQSTTKPKVLLPQRGEADIGHGRPKSLSRQVCYFRPQTEVRRVESRRASRRQILPA